MSRTYGSTVRATQAIRRAGGMVLSKPKPLPPPPESAVPRDPYQCLYEDSEIFAPDLVRRVADAAHATDTEPLS